MLEFLISWEVLWFAVFLCCIVGSVAHESAIGALGLTVLMFLGAWLIFDSGTVAWMAHHPGATLFWAALYLAAGCAWSVLKWYLYVRQHREELRKVLNVWLRTNPDGTRRDFLESGKSPVTVSGNKHRLVTWIAWWPASLLWTLLHDLFVELWDRLYELTRGVYEAVLRRALD